jgi:ABC-type polysaccharide/polyol phosphate transport system ATPase subunit
VTVTVRCDRVRKSYRRSSTLGVKEWFVARRRAPSRFTREWAVEDVSFDVRSGEGFGIIGANGSGKSTLLGVLLGVLRPEAGTVAVRGSIASLLELGAGFHPELTGRQNIFLHGAILGMRLGDVRARFDDIVAFSGLGGAIDQQLRTYSSGMVARLGFAVIAHAAADVLLVDEVLAVGDMEFKEKCLEFLEDFKRREGTLVVVSHDMELVRATCERGLCLAEGRTVAAGAMSDVVRAYRDAAETPRPGVGHALARA